MKDIKKRTGGQGFEEILFHALRSVYLFERAEVERFGLNYQQIYLIKLLKRRPHLRVSDAAAELRIPNFAATRLIKQLESRGLIIKTRDADDRRSVSIRLGTAGEKTVIDIEAHVSSLIAGRLEGFSDKEAAVILSAVAELDFILGLEVRRAAASDR